jgi:hypothetical protein
MRTGVLIWACSLICAALAVVPAQAQFDDEPRQRDSSDALLPLDQILPGVRRDHPGRFYDAEGPFQGPDGQLHYRLKWMTPEGRIVWFDTNARTGRVLGSGGGRRDYDGPGGYDSPGIDERGPPPENDHREGRRNHFNESDPGAPEDWNNGPERDSTGGRWDRNRGDWGGDRNHGDWGGSRGQGWGGDRNGPRGDRHGGPD